VIIPLPVTASARMCYENKTQLIRIFAAITQKRKGHSRNMEESETEVTQVLAPHCLLHTAVAEALYCEG
jgi:hypothetical protein